MIHKTAIVDPGAEIGRDVEIGPYAVIEGNVRIGDGSRIDAHAVVKAYTTMGARCRVHSGAVIGDEPQDLSFKGEPSYTVIGDDCTFREFATVHRGAEPGSTTRLGNHIFMMACSHAAHNTVVGDYTILANAVLLAGHVEVGEHCFLGGGTPVHQFTRIGRYAMVAGGSVLAKDLPPFCITASGANSQVAGLNVVGLRRNGFTPLQRKQIKDLFNCIYREGLNLTQAREKIEAIPAEENPFAAEFAAFLAGTKRGLSQPGRDSFASAPEG